jgi:AICAR transformylase/IMP cyclohydrolase PurH
MGANWPKRSATARTRIRRELLSRRRARPGVASARQVGGKQLSLQNSRHDAASNASPSSTGPDGGGAIIKHAIRAGWPRRLARGGIRKALAAIRFRFGGIVAMNRRSTRGGAQDGRDLHEVIIAPDATEEAIAVSGEKNLGCSWPARPRTRARPVSRSAPCGRLPGQDRTTLSWTRCSSGS